MNSYGLSLAPGAVVDDLIVQQVLGQGAFGITYLVIDKILQRKLALKEYLPRQFVSRERTGEITTISSNYQCAFNDGLNKFLYEGRILAALNHINVVKIERIIQTNNTAYLLMPFYEGEELATLLKRGGAFQENEINHLVQPLLDALEYIHSKDLVHRDIKPSNIYLTTKGSPLLIDFGAARVTTNEADSYTAMGSDGYAALEQVSSSGRIGPWTDIYGLAATLYRLITGSIPTSASDRTDEFMHSGHDPHKALSNLDLLGYSSGLLNAIDAGLSLKIQDRPRSVDEWRSYFRNERTATASDVPKMVDRQFEDEEEFPKDKRPWGLYITVVGVLITLLGTAFYTILSEPEKKAAAEAEIAMAEAEIVREDTIERDNNAWTRAFSADTPEAYRAYLLEFPDGKSAELAWNQLSEFEKVAWADLQNNESIEGYEKYLGLYPDSPNIAIAKGRRDALKVAEDILRAQEEKRIRDDLTAWNSARNVGTRSAVEGYLAAYQQGDHAADARSLLQQIEKSENDTRAYRLAQRAGTKTAFQNYLTSFPSGNHATEAMQALDDLTFRPGKLFSDCGGCPQMIVIGPGSFNKGAGGSEQYGQPSEKPSHMVRIGAMFAFGVHEVTFAEWDQCTAERGCSALSDDGWGRGRRPVINVSWEVANQYTAWLSAKTGESYRLPSESEWEYAARSGEANSWIGGAPNRICQFANGAGIETGANWAHRFCQDQHPVGTAPVGSYEANAFGLHDVIGNVAEWTQDCASLSYIDAPTDGSPLTRGMCSNRIVRGGGWFNGAADLRFAARTRLGTRRSNDFTGLRVVREINE